MNNNVEKKEKENGKGPDKQELQMDKWSSLTCWLCKERHRLMNCNEFKTKNQQNTEQTWQLKKLCKNYFSKTHLLKDCICQMKCRAYGCGRKHHTMYHLQNQYQASVNSTMNEYSTNQDSVRTFLQVIPVKVKHGANTTVVNALLDSGSYTTLITSDLAKALKLKCKQRTLDITNAISLSVSAISKLIELQYLHVIILNRLKLKTQGCWRFNLPSQSVSKAKKQQRWSHLRDVPIDIINKDVSILIGADLPHLHICHSVISGGQNEPTAMLTKLGWVLLGGNGD